MALCFNCGAVFNDEDLKDHVCKIVIPKGKEINPSSGLVEPVGDL